MWLLLYQSTENLFSDGSIGDLQTTASQFFSNNLSLIASRDVGIIQNQGCIFHWEVMLNQVFQACCICTTGIEPYIDFLYLQE
jgi:hypothetical protein